MSERVDFFIVGAMKSGTSSVRNALAKNPRIDMYLNEAHFFSSDEKFAQGIEQYHSLFDFEGDYEARGEKSPPYSVVDAAPERIKDYNPAARIIWIFRSPVERAISHFHHAKKRDSGSMSIEEAIDRRHNLERRRSSVAYVYRSQYEKHIQRYIDLFGVDQNYVMIFEELLSNPRREMMNLHNFLGVDVPQNLEFPHSNKAPVSVVAENPVPESTVERLKLVLEPTVTALEAYLDRPLSAWRADL